MENVSIETKRKFGEDVAYHRNLLGISQKEFANMVEIGKEKRGISRMTLFNIENLKSDPRLDTVAGIVEAFGVRWLGRIGNLLGNHKKNTIPPHREKIFGNEAELTIIRDTEGKYSLWVSFSGEVLLDEELLKFVSDILKLDEISESLYAIFPYIDRKRIINSKENLGERLERLEQKRLQELRLIARKKLKEIHQFISSKRKENPHGRKENPHGRKENLNI